jgi:hypothetical protein
MMWSSILSRNREKNDSEIHIDWALQEECLFYSMENLKNSSSIPGSWLVSYVIRTVKVPEFFPEKTI